MANQSKLKAWVRYDGTGRVVTAGPIFQANKPKVGNWRQINSGLCCNGSSTTTTTTQGGGSVTPTAFVKGYWLNTNDSCTTTLAGSLVFYSASTDVQAGITVFSDAELTIPVTQGYVIYSGPMMAETRYLVGAGGVLSVYVCPTFYNADYQFGGVGNPCNYTGQFNVPLNITGDPCSGGTVALASGSWGDYGISNGATIVVNLNTGNTITLNVFGSSAMSFGCTACPIVNSQTFYIGGNSVSACAQTSSQIIYWNGNFEDTGTAVYSDVNLTLPLGNSTFVNPNTSVYYNVSNGIAVASGTCGA